MEQSIVFAKYELRVKKNIGEDIPPDHHDLIVPAGSRIKLIDTSIGHGTSDVEFEFLYQGRTGFATKDQLNNVDSAIKSSHLNDDVHKSGKGEELHGDDKIATTSGHALGRGAMPPLYLQTTEFEDVSDILNISST